MVNAMWQQYVTLAGIVLVFVGAYACRDIYFL